MQLKRILLIFLTALIAFALLTQIPAVKDRLYWGYIQAEAYLRGAINPAGAVPTPLPSPTFDPLLSPTSTGAPVPSPTALLPTATSTTTPTPEPLPGSVYLEPPAWQRQDINNCGPASLALYLNYYGWEGDQFDISDVIKPERADRNVNVEELTYFAWNYAGWLPLIHRVGGDIQLLKTLIANGIPVMIEEGDRLAESYWPDDDMWAGHFLLLTGYDDEQGIFYAQDTFRQQDLLVSYTDTDARWKYFNRMYLVAYLPYQEDTVRQILGAQWDAAQNRQHALEVAQAEIDADPEDALAYFNLGSNLVYFERYAEAVTAYDQSRVLGLPQRMFRYQFGPFHALFQTGRTDDLLALIDYAMDITPNSEEAWLWRGWALYQQGDYDGAIAAFRRSYQENYQSFDAQYALDHMGVDP
ncbi:MAG: tetratricopeptide repeat protein [Chloroflexota bacterium]